MIARLKNAIADVVLAVGRDRLWQEHIKLESETRRLRELFRRCAEHLGNECHTGIHDITTHRALWAECEREGWTNGGKER